MLLNLSVRHLLYISMGCFFCQVFKEIYFIKTQKICEGEYLRVANGRNSPSRSPFLATAGIAFGLHKFYYVNYNLFKDL